MIRPEVTVDPRNKIILARMEKAWREIGESVVTETAMWTQRRVVKNTPRDRGMAQASVKFSVAEAQQGFDSIWTGSVYSELENNQYMAVLEHGRKPNSRMPPRQQMEIWVRRHFPGKSEVELKGLTFQIRRAIARRGLPAHKMFQQAFEAAGPFMNKTLKREMQKFTSRMS